MLIVKSNSARLRLLRSFLARGLCIERLSGADAVTLAGIWVGFQHPKFADLLGRPEIP